MSESFRNVLVIGGTGMLRHAVHELVDRGSRVVVVARNPDGAAPSETGAGEFVPIAADWEAPGSLIDAVSEALNGRRVELVVVWVHAPYRMPLMLELERVVASDAVVVQVWGSAGRDPREALTGERVLLSGRTNRDVVLGYIAGDDGPRWLTDLEISDGALRAIDQAEASRVIGQIDPWSQRP